jgi:hypothetical protein
MTQVPRLALPDDGGAFSLGEELCAESGRAAYMIWHAVAGMVPFALALDTPLPGGRGLLHEGLTSMGGLRTAKVTDGIIFASYRLTIDGWRAMTVEELLSFGGNSIARPPPEATTLTEAIRQLRKVLALEPPLGLTTKYLVQLQDALEVAERAVSAERWTCEGCEFQGE